MIDFHRQLAILLMTITNENDSVQIMKKAFILITCIHLFFSSVFAENLLSDPNFKDAESNISLWLKSKSGPKWGHTFQLPSHVLSLKNQELTIDFSEAPQDMIMAALKIPMLPLKSEYDYEFRFEIKAENPTSIIVSLPEKDSTADKSRGEWFHVHQGFKELRSEFNYNAMINKGDISLFFQSKNKKDRITIRNMKLVEVQL